MNAAAAALQARMAELSARAWGRPWVDHLEYSLWHALIHGPMRFGRSNLVQAELDDLHRRSRACDGWITRAQDGDFLCLPLRAWQDRYAANVEVLRLDTPTPPPHGLS